MAIKANSFSGPATTVAANLFPVTWRHRQNWGRTKVERHRAEARAKNKAVFAYLNPYDSHNLYLAISDSQKKTIKLFQSKDQGRTWNSYARYTPGSWEDAKRHNIRMMIVKGQSNSAIYLATMDGLYRSLNAGKSWDLLGGIQSAEANREKRSKILSLVGSDDTNQIRKTGRDSGRLTVETYPVGARVRILNIKPKFEQGMLLAPGKYRLDVSFNGYKTKDFWITIKPGEKKWKIYH